MIALKEGVRLLGIRPELVIAIVITGDVYESFGESLVITSVVDGQHMRASLHYVGAAFGARLPSRNPDALRQRLAEALGADFDVVLEETHIHVEWQPKVAL